MGAFVLGILFGWLLEWLFFTYWIKGRSSGRFADIDCSNVKSKLAEKESEISALKAELQSANQQVQSVSVSPSASVAEKSDSSSDKKSAATTKKPSVNTASKAKSATDKKTSDKQIAKTVKKATSKPKSKSKASVAKNPKATTGAKKKGDDFTKLTGIGPSMSNKLKSLGITTFKKLSEMDDNILRAQLVEAGAKLNNNKEAIDSWNEQAALAEKGDFDGLKKLQESLKP